MTLGQVIKGHILVSKVLKEDEIIHIGQCRAVRILTWCCFLMRLHLGSIKAMVLTSGMSMSVSIYDFASFHY